MKLFQRECDSKPPTKIELDVISRPLTFPSPPLLLCGLGVFSKIEAEKRSEILGEFGGPTDLNLAFIYHRALKAKQSETQRLN